MSMLEKNLTFLFRNQKSLYEKFKDFTPFNICFDENQRQDIIVSGEPFYNMDPMDACKMQVSHFIQHPSHFSLKLTDKPGNTWIHQQAINTLNARARELDYQAHTQPDISNLVALGSGLGYYFEHLINFQRFKNIVLVEPDDDMLFHFLSTIDIRDLSDHCAQSDGVFSIIQPNSTSDFSSMMMQLFETHGFGFLAEISVYRHYETPLFDDIFDDFISYRDKWFSAWGFFCDEMIGLKHTFENANLHQFVRNCGDIDAKSELANAPVVIVGNGPSLDNDIACLQQISGKVIIISCGTSLGALSRNGIKPDFHAEMERSLFTALVQKPWYEPSLCENTTLLALNTVPPESTSQFKKCLMFAKANDIGAQVLESTHNDNITSLYFCNPTVTNFALSAVLSLGHHNIILLGCDFGYREDDVHHAKSSDYFQADSYLSSVQIKDKRLAHDANGLPMFTTRIFNAARTSMEQLIARNGHAVITNCSNGVVIAGTKTKKLIDVELRSLDKTKHIEVLHASIDLTTKSNKAELTDFSSDSLKSLGELISILDSNHSPSKLEIIMQQMLCVVLNKDKSGRDKILFSGILKYVSTLIAGHIARIPIQNRDTYYLAARSQVMDMLLGAQNELKILTKGNVE